MSQQNPHLKYTSSALQLYGTSLLNRNNYVVGLRRVQAFMFPQAESRRSLTLDMDWHEMQHCTVASLEDYTVGCDNSKTSPVSVVSL